MRLLKRLFFFVLILIGILLVIALFVSKDYRVERSVTINKSQAEVFSYIRMLGNQNQYSKWAKMDPQMKVSFRGTDGQVGFVSAWDGNKDVGKGEQEIKRINEGRSMETEIRFLKPYESTAQGKMEATQVSETQTNVTWEFSGHMPYPLNLMRVLGMEKMVGNDLQTGLNNLKALQEAK